MRFTRPLRGLLPFSESLPEPMSKGLPPRKVVMPLIDQPPRTLDRAPEVRCAFPGPAGSSYTQLISP
jgi:hypothetical protein